MPPTKLLMTQSLLAAWQYQYTAYDAERAHLDFMRVLRRNPTPRTKAIQDGIRFENMVTAFCNGVPPDADHPWAAAIEETGKLLHGAQFQVAAYRKKRVDGVPFLLYGRLDGLKAGTIFDIKFSRSYEVGKYTNSPQHPMYFECVPEAKRFAYVISDGKRVYVEEYRREETPPPDGVIREFMRYLEYTDLAAVYINKWRTRG